MIVNRFLQWIIELLGGSHFNVSFDGSIPDFLKLVFNLVAYILPLDVLIEIAVITFALYIFRLTVSVITSIWNLIPVA